MSFRNVIIESPARLKVQNEQLVVCMDRDHSMPIEDLSAVLLESRQSTITTAALSRLGQCGCAVFVCDEKHLPCAVLLPFSQHSRALAAAGSQLSASLQLKKRLWQQIVISKIQNQAICLSLNDKHSDEQRLLSMLSRVRSGDTENVEAVAAQAYFPALFWSGFVREEECLHNAALNYGYAILRGCMARCLAVYGFLPAFGIHHHSTLNGFNLADDFMEPFRPVIDLLVSRLDLSGGELTPEIKRALFNCLNLDILSGGSHHSVAYAMERMAQSFSRSLTQNEAALCLPTLLETAQHRYE